MPHRPSRQGDGDCRPHRVLIPVQPHGHQEVHLSCDIAKQRLAGALGELLTTWRHPLARRLRIKVGETVVNVSTP